MIANEWLKSSFPINSYTEIVVLVRQEEFMIWEERATYLIDFGRHAGLYSHGLPYFAADCFLWHGRQFAESTPFVFGIHLYIPSSLA